MNSTRKSSAHNFWNTCKLKCTWFSLEKKEKIKAILLHIDEDRWWHKYISITCNFIFISKVKTKALTRSLASSFRGGEKAGILKDKEICLKVHNYKPDKSLSAWTTWVCAYLCECVCAHACVHSPQLLLCRVVKKHFSTKRGIQIQYTQC